MKRSRNLIEPYASDGRFRNHRHEEREGFVFRSVSMFMQSCAIRMRKSPESTDYVACQPPIERSLEPVITWIGHSTFLIQIGNINILTDPIFGNLTLLYPRIVQPGISLAQLPPIDVVLISHNHMDHLEKKTLKVLARRNPHTKICVPAGAAAFALSCGFKSIYASSWWDAHAWQFPFLTDNQLTCTFVPVHHWSGRGLFDYNKSLWGGWVITHQDTSIYFGGDSAYCHHFHEVADRFHALHTAILPIGPCEPRAWMSQHMDAADACRAFLDLGAHHFVPMHWGTFHFGIEEPDLPLKRVRAWWQEHAELLVGKVLCTPKVGERLTLPNLPLFQPARVVYQQLG